MYDDPVEGEKKANLILSEFTKIDPHFQCSYTGIYYWIEKYPVNIKTTNIGTDNISLGIPLEEVSTK